MKNLFRVLVLGLCTAAGAAPVAEAQEINTKRAHEAFHAAKAYKNQGELLHAERLFQIARDSAPADSNIRFEASEELEYYLPLMKIQRLVWDGQTEVAEQALLALQQKFEDQPIRRQQIGQIVIGLRDSAAQAAGTEDKKVNERLLLRQVKALLHGFYVDHDRYPNSEAELADLLPPNQPPLSSFGIRRYATQGDGYLLILESKENAGQLLTIQNTGLMQ